MREVVDVDLRLVCACSSLPVSHQLKMSSLCHVSTRVSAFVFPSSFSHGVMFRALQLNIMTVDVPVLITHSPSSLTRTHWLASSNSKSCSSSTRFAYSASCFRLRFRLRASHSGRGRAVDAPAMVYTGTTLGLESFILRAVQALPRSVCPMRCEFLTRN